MVVVIMNLLARAYSARPVDVLYSSIAFVGGSVTNLALHPNRVGGQPVWIPDASQSHGQRLNPAAFAVPPGAPIEGNLGPASRILRGLPLIPKEEVRERTDSPSTMDRLPTA